MKKGTVFEIILMIVILLTFHREINGQTEKKYNTYTVTIRIDTKDSTFKIKTIDTEDKYNTDLWISDPECTECKDCYVDSGEVKIPEALKQYIRIDKSTFGKDIYLTCNNPYQIENTSYVKYKINGHFIGVKYGYLVFCVDKWSRCE